MEFIMAELVNGEVIYNNFLQFEEGRQAIADMIIYKGVSYMNTLSLTIDQVKIGDKPMTDVGVFEASKQASLSLLEQELNALASEYTAYCQNIDLFKITQ